MNKGKQKAVKRRVWCDAERDILREVIALKIGIKESVVAACGRLPERTEGQVRCMIGRLRKTVQTAAEAIHDPGVETASIIQELTEKKMRNVFKRPSIVRTCILRTLAREKGTGACTHDLTPSMETINSMLKDLRVLTRVGSKTNGLSVRAKQLRLGRKNKIRHKSPRLNSSNLRDRFNKETRKVARLILDNKQEQMCPIKHSLIEAHFKDKWEAADDYTHLGQFSSKEVSKNIYLARPITQLEVRKTRAKILKDSAAGPDKVKKITLCKWDPDGKKLASMYNGFLVNGKIPDPLRSNITTLIQKSTLPSERLIAANYRPITIGSMVIRLFSSILFQRLASACPTSERQKGFRAIPGCSENLVLIEGLLKDATKFKKPLAMVFY